MFLSDMQIFCDKILRYTNGLNQQAFFANDVVLDAVLRNLELLGEASKQIPEDVRQLNSEVPWRRISGLRDLLAHAYLGLEEDSIWQNSNQYPRPLKQVIQCKKSLIIGGFALEGRGGLVVMRLEGCFGNVIGLSLPLLRRLLKPS